MCKVNRFALTIIQFVLLVDNTKQSKIKQGINILKTIGNTVKKPISKTIGNTIKNVASGLEKGGKQYLRSSNNVATKSVKYLREGALHKYKVPQGVRGSNQLIRSGAKKSTQMRSAEQMGEKGLKSLVNMVSQSKPQLPFLFAAGGFTKLSQFNLVPENDAAEKIPATDIKSQNPNLKFFDIAANMNDDMFKGIYLKKNFHEADFDHIIKRANDYKVDKFLFVGGSLADTLASAKLCEGKSNCWTTVGVHPCCAYEIEKDGGKAEDYYENMEKTIIKLGKKCSAIGECGLDYARQKLTDKETQLKHFPMHFDFAEKFKLPMYFHMRDAGSDFLRIVKENRHRFSEGVVHSFTGTEEELNKIIGMGLYISINGCGLKTEENLKVVKKIPLDRIMLETDCPYCQIRPMYAGHKYVKTTIEHIAHRINWQPDKMIKHRNEPCKMIQVCEAVAALKGVSEEELAQVAYENSVKIFAREE